MSRQPKICSRSPSGFRSCERTLYTLVQNALENVENKILEVLDMVGEKVRRIKKDGAKLYPGSRITEIRLECRCQQKYFLI
jgi:hypothetical protein